MLWKLDGHDSVKKVLDKGRGPPVTAINGNAEFYGELSIRQIYDEVKKCEQLGGGDMNKFVVASFFKSIRQGDFKVVYWDGEVVQYGQGNPKVTIIFRQSPPLHFDLQDAVLTFGEAYMDEVIDFEGDLEEIIRIVELNKAHFLEAGFGGKVLSALQSLNSTASKEKQKEISNIIMI